MLLIAEHRHAIRASAFTGLYLVLSMVIDAIETRSYFKRDMNSLGAISAASIAVRLTLLVLDEVSKVNLIIDPIIRDASGREATSGFWSRSFFVFMTPLFRIGFKRKILLQDLSPIGIEFSSKRLFAELSRNWKPTEQMGKYSLMLACFFTWKSPFYATLLPRLLLTGFNFSQPYLLQAVVKSIGPRSNASDRSIFSDISRLDPYLVAATLLAFVGSGLSRGVSSHMKYRLVIRVRGGLISLSMDKSQRLNVPDAQKNTPISLMSSEIGGIAESLPDCIEIPFIFFESGLGIYLLWRFIQRSGFVIIFPLVFATAVSMIWGHFSAPAMKVWNEHIESRVSKTSQILSQLPAIKMMGLGPKVAEYIQTLRVRETDVSKTFRTIRAGSIATASLCDLITPTTIVAAALFWGGFGGKFTPDIVYPVLALVAHVQEPLAALFHAIPSAKTMVIFFSRVQDFLCLKEYEDPRKSLDQAESQVSPQSTLILFEDATVAPRCSDTAVLKNIDFEIRPGSTTAVLGPTGSGKSTMIDAILGETDLLEGKVFAGDIAIAYCGQTVYLPNTTIEECIIGQCAYDESWFNTVVEACQLAQDLRQLPGGKSYVIGPDGIALSGGQRVRVSIARAVFCLTELVVLDDSLSSLDRPTGRALLQALLGEGGLLKRNHVAVVISSNMVDCIDFADQYVVLEDEGQVSISTPESDPDIRTRLEWLFGSERTETVDNAGPTVVKVGDQSSSVMTAESDLQEADDKLRQQGGLSLYSSWLKYAGNMAFSGWLFLIILTGIADGSPKIVLRYWVAKAVYDETYFIVYTILPFVAAGLCFISLLILFRLLGPRAAQGLHGELTNTVFKASLGVLSAANTGSMMNLYSLDMTLVARTIPTHTHNTFYFLSGSLMQLGIILAGAIYLLAAVPFLGLILFYLQRYYLRTSRQLRHLDLESQAPLVSSIQDMSRGLVYIRSFGWQAQNMERNFRLIDQAQNPVYSLYCAQIFLTLVLDLLAAILALLLTVFAIYAKHADSGNAVGVSFLSLIVISQCFNAVIVSWTHLETSIGAVNRLRKFAQNTPKEQDGDQPLPTNWPSVGNVEVSIDTARYATGMNQPQRPPVLKDVSLSIEPGTKVGIIGRSGSGKTSLLLSLLGFLEYDGSIKIDGVEIRDTRRDELRSRIVTIAQDNLVLEGTIRQNLLPFDTQLGEQSVGPLTEKQSAEEAQKDLILREVLVRLRLWDSLEECGELHAIVGKLGYSRGELQMLCIARAVVHRRLTGSRLVLVDEGTSNVDRWRDSLVRQTMKQYFSDCTIIVIAHRDETIADAKTTITMSDGKVIRRR